MPRISPLALRLKHHINFPSDVSHPPLTNLAEHILQPFLHAQPKIRARADPSNGLWMNSTVLVTKEDARTGWNPAYAASLKIPANLRGAEGHLERRALAARGGWYPHSKRVAGFNRNSPTAFLWRKTVQPHSFYSSIVKKAETPLVELMATPGKSWEAMGVHLRHRVDGMNGADKGWVPCFESSDPRERLGGLAESVESKWLDIEAGKVVDMPVAEPETATIPATAAPATPKQPKSPKQPKQTPALSGSPWSFPVPAPQKFVAKGTPAPAPAPKPAPPAAEKQTTRYVPCFFNRLQSC